MFRRKTMTRREALRLAVESGAGPHSAVMTAARFFAWANEMSEEEALALKFPEKQPKPELAA